MTDAANDFLRRLTEKADARRSEAWDRWYATLPADLRRKLSLHDFKRLGDCFRLAFGIEKIVEPR